MKEEIKEEMKENALTVVIVILGMSLVFASVLTMFKLLMWYYNFLGF